MRSELHCSQVREDEVHQVVPVRLYNAEGSEDEDTDRSQVALMVFIPAIGVQFGKPTLRRWLLRAGKARGS